MRLSPTCSAAVSGGGGWCLSCCHHDFQLTLYPFSLTSPSDFLPLSSDDHLCPPPWGWTKRSVSPPRNLRILTFVCLFSVFIQNSWVFQYPCRQVSSNLTQRSSLPIFLSSVSLQFSTPTVICTTGLLIARNSVSSIIVILSITFSASLLLSFLLTPSGARLREFSDPLGETIHWFCYSFIILYSLLVHMSSSHSIPSSFFIVIIIIITVITSTAWLLLTPLSLHRAHVKNLNCAQFQTSIHAAGNGWRKNPIMLVSL